MNRHIQNSVSSPRLPRLIQIPISFVPAQIRNRVIIESLNRIFRRELIDEELAFLNQKTVQITIDDANISFEFTCDNNSISAAPGQQPPDLIMRGNSYDFLLMLSRSEDPDTLFFNRRLKLTGDTELGLYMKNFLDGLEITGIRKRLQQLSIGALRVAETIHPQSH